MMAGVSSARHPSPEDGEIDSFVNYTIRVFGRKFSVGPITCYIQLLNPNVEYRKPKQTQMTKKQNSKFYDPEDRAFEFARRLRAHWQMVFRTFEFRICFEFRASYLEFNNNQ